MKFVKVIGYGVGGLCIIMGIAYMAALGDSYGATWVEYLMGVITIIAGLYSICLTACISGHQKRLDRIEKVLNLRPISEEEAEGLYKKNSGDLTEKEIEDAKKAEDNLKDKKED